MEGHIGTDKIILLFDTYTQESRFLHASVRNAGYECLAIVIEEDDFLPEDVISVYELFSGDWKAERGRLEKPRFFNEIVVPNHWSITAGVDEPHGRILYQHEEKGRIYYIEPKNRYLVRAVDWLDRKGNVSFRDHYNRYGDICARTIYSAEGRSLSKFRFSRKSQEVLMENYITGDLILNDGGLVKHFRTKIDLICYCFTALGFGKNRIFYNSLSMPFFISNRLEGTSKKDILFWQQPIGEDIPGNMRMILNGEASRTEKIVVQKRSSYDRLLKLGVEKAFLYKMGFIYPYQKKNQYKQEALIYTDSDRLEHCRELIEALPTVHFHIAAITVMSSGLKSLSNYSNVSLYPAVKSPVREELFKRCDYYLDINYYAEIISAVQQAFLHNHLIFAFAETVHNRDYVSDDLIYPVSEFEHMVSDIRATMEDQAVMEYHLKRQKEHALSENQETYRRFLNT